MGAKRSAIIDAERLLSGSQNLAIYDLVGSEAVISDGFNVPLPDEEAKQREYTAFVIDLALAKRTAGCIPRRLLSPAQPHGWTWPYP